MSSQEKTEKRRNKEFILNNSSLLRKYALQNQDTLGTGVIIINLPFVEKKHLKHQDIQYYSPESTAEKNFSLQQPLSYLPVGNFWFRAIKLKIKNKYQIDIEKDYDLESKFLFVFIKDCEMEYFSIYAVKLG